MGNQIIYLQEKVYFNNPDIDYKYISTDIFYFQPLNPESLYNTLKVQWFALKQQSQSNNNKIIQIDPET